MTVRQGIFFDLLRLRFCVGTVAKGLSHIGKRLGPAPTIRMLLVGKVALWLAWLVVLLVMLATEPTPARADTERFTARDTLAALKHSSQQVRCVVAWEVGGANWEPYSIGPLGELGPIQLKPGGELERFYAEGGTDPFSPYETIPYLERAIEDGRGRAWAPIYWGMC